VASLSGRGHPAGIHSGSVSPMRRARSRHRYHYFCGNQASGMGHRATKPRAIIRSMQLTAEQVAAIINWAKRTPQVQAVVLIGSRCKGTARPDSDVDLALTMTKGRWERRFKNYRDNVNAWERELTDAVGLTVYVRSLHPALGPEVPAAVKQCSIKLWRRDG
jgi:predicted nucleotidyltransferase